MYNFAVTATNSEKASARLLRSYLDAVRLIEPVQTRIWKTAEVTLTQVRALRRLAREPYTLSRLGAELALAPASVTRLVDRLEKRGLTTRRRDDEDRRKVFVTLTEAGAQLVHALPFLEGSSIRAAVEQLTIADRHRIAAAIEDFNAAVARAEASAVAEAIEA